MRLGELWALFESLGEPKSDNSKKAALIRGIRGSLPGIFQQLVAQPQLDYAGLARVLVSATSYMQEERAGEESPALGMRATVKCGHCGKAGHSVSECWAAHPETKPAGRSKVKCFNCQKHGHLKRNCPEIANRNTPVNNNTNPVPNYPRLLNQTHKHQNPIVDSGCTLHLTNNANRLEPTTTTNHHALIRQADGTTLQATRKGHTTLKDGLTRRGVDNYRSYKNMILAAYWWSLKS